MPAGGPKYDFGRFVEPGATPKIKSIFDFTAEALEQFAFWLEQRGLHIPANQILGFNLERQSSRVRLGSNQSIANGAEVAITFTASDYDYGSLWDSATKFVIGQRGLYLVGGSAVFETNSTGDRVVYVKKNGTEYLSSMSAGAASAVTTEVPVVSSVELNVGDYIELRVFQSSGGALNVLADSRSNMWLTRVGT